MNPLVQLKNRRLKISYWVVCGLAIGLRIFSNNEYAGLLSTLIYACLMYMFADLVYCFLTNKTIYTKQVVEPSDNNYGGRGVIAFIGLLIFSLMLYQGPQQWF